AGVVRDGELVWSFAVGRADVNGVDATPDTSYRIGSITKTFTALLVLRLRDGGVLDLDDPLAEHLPEVGDRRITIRQALSHLSGLQREPPGDVWVTGRMPDTAGLVTSLADAEWLLPPSRRFHYSNLAFALLGRVVEVH